MGKLLLKQLDVKNKKVLLRVDFNVPQRPDGSISDDTRIVESLSSIRYILNHGGSVILLSHLGRPNGKKQVKFSLLPCAKQLSALLGQEVLFSSDCMGKEAEVKASSLKPGQVLLLENLRFYPEEENPSLDLNFAKKLAAYGDLFVNDGFGVSHRFHSSVTEIPKYFKDGSAAGFLMEKEIENIAILLNHPPSPFYALIGGAKVSSKIGILKSLIDKVNALFVGGGMAYTFLKAQGIPIGDSICEDEELETALEIISYCESSKIPLYLPQDFIATQVYSSEAEVKVFNANEGIAPSWQGMDIGPMTRQTWAKLLENAKTIFWNGPFGVCEFPKFAKGTESIAQTLASLKAITIVGGGDSVAAIKNFNLTKSFTHLSTGGGASLEYIENGNLPGIKALSNV